MNRIGIIISSRRGQTEKIAHALARRLRTQDEADVRVWNIRKEDPQSIPIRDLDTIILGSPVYAGQFARSLARWVQKNVEVLNTKDSAFFSVTLNAADQREEARQADDRLLREFLIQTGLRPRFIASFAGALNYTQYGFFLRYMMKRISRSAGGPTDTSRDHELTNWNRVTAFAEAIVAQSPASEFLSARRLNGFQHSFA